MRKRFLFFCLLLLGPIAFASVVVLFDPATGTLKQIIASADTLQYQNRTDALINPVIPTNSWDWLYVTNGYITNWTEGQYLSISNANWLAASNAAYVAFTNYLANLKVDTISTVDASNDLTGRIIRALAETILDELNSHSAKITGILNCIDTNANIGTIKTAILTISDPPQRTLQQLKTSITNKLADD